MKLAQVKEGAVQPVPEVRCWWCRGRVRRTCWEASRCRWPCLPCVCLERLLSCCYPFLLWRWNPQGRRVCHSGGWTWGLGRVVHKLFFYVIFTGAYALIRMRCLDLPANLFYKHCTRPTSHWKRYRTRFQLTSDPTISKQLLPKCAKHKAGFFKGKKSFTWIWTNRIHFRSRHTSLLSQFVISKFLAAQ